MRITAEITSKVDQLTHKIHQLEKENQCLKERLGLHSQNSSLPPSSDRKQEEQAQKPFEWSKQWRSTWASRAFPPAIGFL